ncbi:DivIVA domain-containing protein, partial [Streptococcus pyogenes]
MTSIIYSPKDIFEQEFKTSMRGFDKKEVDEFLDNVIKDYENFNAQIEALKAENEALKKAKFQARNTVSATVQQPV